MTPRIGSVWSEVWYEEECHQEDDCPANYNEVVVIGVERNTTGARILYLTMEDYEGGPCILGTWEDEWHDEFRKIA